MQSGEDFIQGVFFFTQGLKALFKPGIKRYVIMPVIINIILFSVIFYFGMQYLLEKFDVITFTLPNWLSWLNWLIKAIQYILLVLVIIASIGIIALISTLIANLIAAPFNGLLSEKYSNLLGYSSPTQSFGALIINSLGRETRKLGYFLVRFIFIGILAAILFFIPILNMLVPILFFIFGAWYLAVEYCDYAADNFHQPFSQSKLQLKQHRALGFGFGIIVMLLSSVPFLNFIVMPAAVLGGTALWHEINKTSLS